MLRRMRSRMRSITAILNPANLDLFGDIAVPVCRLSPYRFFA